MFIIVIFVQQVTVALFLINVYTNYKIAFVSVTVTKMSQHSSQDHPNREEPSSLHLEENARTRNQTKVLEDLPQPTIEELRNERESTERTVVLITRNLHKLMTKNSSSQTILFESRQQLIHAFRRFEFAHQDYFDCLSKKPEINQLVLENEENYLLTVSNAYCEILEYFRECVGAVRYSHFPHISSEFESKVDSPRRLSDDSSKTSSNCLHSTSGLSTRYDVQSVQQGDMLSPLLSQPIDSCGLSVPVCPLCEVCHLSHSECDKFKKLSPADRFLVQNNKSQYNCLLDSPHVSKFYTQKKSACNLLDCGPVCKCISSMCLHIQDNSVNPNMSVVQDDLMTNEQISTVT